MGLNFYGMITVSENITVLLSQAITQLLLLLVVVVVAVEVGVVLGVYRPLEE